MKIGEKHFIMVKWDSHSRYLIVNPYSATPVCVPLPEGTESRITDLTLLVDTRVSLNLSYAMVALMGAMTENVDISPFYEFPISRAPFELDSHFRGKKKKLVWFRVMLHSLTDPVSVPHF